MRTTSLFLTTVAALTLICSPAISQNQPNNPSARVSGHSSIGAGAGHSALGGSVVNTSTTTVPSVAASGPGVGMGVVGGTTTTTGTTSATPPVNTISGTQSSTSGSINGNIQPDTTPIPATPTPDTATDTAGTVVPPNDTSVTGGTPGETTTPAVTPGVTVSGTATGSTTEKGFNAYDTNNDDNLSQAEYTSLSSQINQPSDININTPTTFHQIDSDGNGSVSALEFKTYAEAHK